MSMSVCLSDSVSVCLRILSSRISRKLLLSIFVCVFCDCVARSSLMISYVFPFFGYRHVST